MGGAAGYRCLEKTSVHSDVSTPPMLWLNGPRSISFKAVGRDQTTGMDTQHFQDSISKGLRLPPGPPQRRVRLAPAKIKGLIWSVSWHNMRRGTPYFGGCPANLARRWSGMAEEWKRRGRGSHLTQCDIRLQRLTFRERSWSEVPPDRSMFGCSQPKLKAQFHFSPFPF